MRRQKRRGNAATLFASATTLVAAAAFVVDIGFLYASQTELQTGVDAAALAGVGYLDGTQEGVDLAISKAVEYGGMNGVLGDPIAIPVEAITTGYIEDDAFVTSNDPDVITALSIDHTKVDVQAFFSAAVFGRQTLGARASSIAVRFAGRGAGRVPCFLPLAIPDCVFDDPNALNNFEGLELKLNSANEDNAGWADLEGNPTPGSINEGLLGQCDRGDANVGDPVYLNNGVINSSLSEVKNVLNGGTSAPTQSWDSTRWGALPSQMSGSTVNGNAYGQNVLEGPIILFDAGGGNCLEDTQFNRNKPITGFAWAVIYDVDSHGSGKNIRVKLDLTNPYEAGTTGGGLDTNVLAPGNGALFH